MPTWLTSIFAMVPEAATEFAAFQANPIVQELEALGEKYLLHTPTPGASVVVEPAATATT
jgi:hypothetical protein